MRPSAADLVVLDTLANLHAHGHGLNGYCRSCGRFYNVPMATLIAVRGADSPVWSARIAELEAQLDCRRLAQALRAGVGTQPDADGETSAAV
jgi:hypothetical protein